MSTTSAVGLLQPSWCLLCCFRHHFSHEWEATFLPYSSKRANSPKLKMKRSSSPANDELPGKRTKRSSFAESCSQDVEERSQTSSNKVTSNGHKKRVRFQDDVLNTCDKLSASNTVSKLTSLTVQGESFSDPSLNNMPFAFENSLLDQLENPLNFRWFMIPEEDFDNQSNASSDEIYYSGTNEPFLVVG